MSNANSVDRPVFIVGPHRSGTTLLYGIIAAHEQVCFLDRNNHRFPSMPRFARLLDSLLGTDLKPVEAQRFWDYMWVGPDDVMDSDDLTHEQRRFYQSVLADITRLRGKSRFIAKTGQPQRPRR